MKRKVTLLVLLLVVLLVVGCQKETNSTQDTLKAIADAAKTLKSFHMVGDVDMDLGVGASGEEMPFGMKISMNMDADMIIDPYQARMSINLKAPVAMEMKSYIVDGHIYMQNPMDGTWMETPYQDGLTPDAQTMDMQSKFLDIAVKKPELYKVTEEEGDLVITFTGSEEDLKAMLKEIDEAGPSDQMTGTFDQMKNFKIDSYNIKGYYDKATYLPKRVLFDMQGKLSEKQEQTMVMKMDITYDKINEIEAIEVPSDVKPQ